MDKGPPHHKTQPGSEALPAVDQKGVPVWVVSEDGTLMQQLDDVLHALTGNVSHFSHEGIDDAAIRRRRSTPPMLIILDVAHDMDRGLRTIQKLKRHRVNAPIIAFTQNISREFGAKIISQGVRYYFSRDFNPRELLEVADSYLKVGLPAASADEK